MNEGQVLGLAGVFQAAELVNALANGKSCPDFKIRTSLESLFRIDAPNAAAVYGGAAKLSVGLDSIVRQFESDDRNVDVTRIAVTILELERKYNKHKEMQKKVREGIESAQRSVDAFDATHESVIARLADIYLHTLSTLKPKVMVHGDATHLTQERTIGRIRALLLAAVRSAVLWRQMGGGAISLIFKRRRVVEIAREILGE